MPLWQKIKNWYSGYADVQDNLNNPEKPNFSITVHKPSWLKITFEVTTKFWIRRWPILLPSIVAFSVGLVPLYIHLDSKTNTKTDKNTSNQVSIIRNQSSQLVTHNKSSSRKENVVTPKEPASRTYARQQVERWRKEIQSLASGESFDKQKFLNSVTYTEMYPFLSSKTVGELRDPTVKIRVPSERSGKVIIGNEALELLYKDLDLIATK